MLQVRLQPGLPNGPCAYVRALRGHDEDSVEAETAFAATDLLDRLLVEAPDTSVGPGSAANLPLCDRDLLLAEIYRRDYGGQIEALAACNACEEDFEVVLALDELLQGYRPERSLDGGVFDLGDGRRFRLPTTADQRAVAGLAEAEAVRRLLERCQVEGEPGDVETIERAMEEAGPTLTLDLAAKCPHCAASQQVHFDIQAHLVGTILKEKRWLLREVHCLARAYGWSRSEILDLPRDDRRAYVRLIQAETRSGAGGGR